jgi:WD40 repeat protein
VRFSPNNEKLVSVGTDKKIVFYTAEKMEVIKEIPDAHAGGIYGVSWSPNSQYILTASADKTCKKWYVT